MMSIIRSYLPEKINSDIWYYVGNIIYKTQPLIDTDFTANQITDTIYIGNLASSLNKDAMREHKITHILSIMNGGYEVHPDDFVYKIIHINDDPWIDIGKYFDEVVSFIDNALENKSNKILVHCHQGVSRSVTMVCCYLLWKKNNERMISQEDVLEEILKTIEQIRGKRNIANPNNGFIYALHNYIHKINNYPIISNLNIK